MKKSVENTMKRVGIWDAYQHFTKFKTPVTVSNRFGFGSCETSKSVEFLINWVYDVSNQYEMGIRKVNVSDFDRIRYFIADEDSNAYMTCID